MNLLKWFVPQGKLSPASQSEYARAFVQIIGVQITIIVFFLPLLFWAESQRRVDLYIVGNLGLILAMLVVSLRVFRRIDIRRRLMDLYPTAKMPSSYFVGLVTTSPLTFLPVSLFLVLKSKREVEEPMPLFFRRSRLIGSIVFGLLLLPMFAAPAAKVTTSGVRELLSRFASTSYIFSNPTSHYVASISQEVTGVLGAVESGGDQERMDRLNFKPVNVAKDHLRSSAGALILAIKTVKQAEQQRARVVASDEKNSLFISLLGDLLSIVEVWDQKRSILTRLNPLYFINPISMTEVTFLSLIDQVIEHNFRMKFISVLEEKINSEKVTDWKRNDPGFAVAIDEFQRKLHQTRAYQAVLISKSFLFAINL